MRFLFTLTAIALLSGCAAMQQAKNQETQVQADIAYKAGKDLCWNDIAGKVPMTEDASDVEIPRGKGLKLAECVTRAAQSSFQMVQHFSPHGASLLAFRAEVEKLALQFDQGKISQEEWRIVQKEKYAQFMLAQQNTNLQLQQIEAQQATQRAAAWQNLSNHFQQQQMMQQQQNLYQQQMLRSNMPRQTNCHAFGNSLNCTTF